MNDIFDILKTLADETRLRILVLLSQSSLCVCEICGILSLSQPKVSKHIAILRKSGFVQFQKIDKYIIYSLSAYVPLIKEITSEMERYLQLKADSDRLDMKGDFRCQCRELLKKKKKI